MNYILSRWNIIEKFFLKCLNKLSFLLKAVALALLVPPIFHLQDHELISQLSH